MLSSLFDWIDQGIEHDNLGELLTKHKVKWILYNEEPGIIKSFFIYFFINWFNGEDYRKHSPYNYWKSDCYI